jgi:hypothetical protein
MASVEAEIFSRWKAPPRANPMPSAMVENVKDSHIRPLAVVHPRRSHGRDASINAGYNGATGIAISQVKTPVFGSKLASVG